MRSPARKFEDLIVWQKAHAYVLAVYSLTSSFPKSEKYGLVSQFRRAAVSVPANIAEGWRWNGIADKKRFYNISQASLEESRYYLLLAKDLEYGESSKANSLSEEVSKLLTAYIKNIKLL
ncbi:MAG: four helix bundle protein [Candidatus Marinimicrobia bacterium]|nr:four helix bundle protein [Candidatus Neomarinimicrobiota bacterium]